MWMDEVSGKYRFRERFKDNLTGKAKIVSVTLSKNTATTRKQAAIELEKKIANAQIIKTSTELTLHDLVNKYRLYQEQTVKQSTYRRNYHTCNTLLNILGANTLVNSLTSNYIKERLLSSRNQPSTLNEYRARLRALLNWGYENDYIDSVDYLRKFKLFKDDTRKLTDEKYLEPDELTLLLKYIDEKQATTWWLLTQFLVLTGLRVGEAVALTIKDIHFDTKIISVTKTYDYNNKIVTSTKTACSTRDVFMQKELYNLCKLICIKMKEQKLLYGYKASPLFLTSSIGGYIAYNSYNKYLKEISIKLLNKKITPHILRHTHASILLALGVDIETISRRLGHENSKITKDIYLHVTEKLKEKDNKQIENIKII